MQEKKHIFVASIEDVKKEEIVMWQWVYVGANFAEITIMDFLILGAGPAGLTFANKLKRDGKSFLIIEKEMKAGGLCRSEIVDDYPFDIGGGHFLDVKYKEVNDFLFEFMPRDEWMLYERNSKISMNGMIISHPLEANIWQMDFERQVEYLKSIAMAGCNIGQDMPSKFIDWIYWKLGKKIADGYMIPYNKKLFGEDLNELGTYWLEKLPDVSFDETLMSCLKRKAYGCEPGHTQFLYPIKYGYGEIWRRMAEKNHIVYSRAVNSIDFSTNTVTLSGYEKYSAKYIVTTIPWMEFDEILGMPEDIVTLIEKLKYSSIYTSYHAENLNTDAQWIYYPSPDLPYHRILVRHNFCIGSRGYWTETNSRRFAIDGEKTYFYNRYAYPLNTVQKPNIMDKLLNWAKSRNVFGLGRWGEHQHYNSDVVVKRALDLYDAVCG